MADLDVPMKAEEGALRVFRVLLMFLWRCAWKLQAAMERFGNRLTDKGLCVVVNFVVGNFLLTALRSMMKADVSTTLKLHVLTKSGVS